MRMRERSWRRALLIAGVMAAAAVAVAPARAEVSEVRIAQQYGIGYLPLHVIKHKDLLAKHAKAQGSGSGACSISNSKPAEERQRDVGA